MPAPVWSRRSIVDLQRIQDYLDAVDEDMARRVIAFIRASTLRLVDHPRSGSPLDGGGRRKLSVPRYSYVVIYRIVGDQTRILRVRHTSEDWRPR